MKAPPQTPGELEVLAGQKAVTNAHALALDGISSIRPIFKAQGHRVECGAERLRVEGMACGKCGIKEITAKNVPALFILANGVLPRDPQRLQCEGCGWNVKASELLPHLFESYTDRQRFLEKHFRGYKPQPQRFFAARFDDKVALEEFSFEAAIRKVLPPQHDCMVDTCVIRALDKPAATDRLHAGDIPWKPTPITPQGRVVTTTKGAG